MHHIILGSLLAMALGDAAAAQEVTSGASPDVRPSGELSERFRGPARGPLFISPMGEPFRGRPDAAAPQEQWFEGADSNGDGSLTSEEMEADAARFFVTLDQRKDGEIDPDDIERYETVLAPEIRVAGMGGQRMGMARSGEPRAGRGGRGRGGPGGGGGGRFGGGKGRLGGGEGAAGEMRDTRGKQGAGRFGYLDYPQPVTAADSNLNRGVDTAEFRKAAQYRFTLLDTNKDGKLDKGELPTLRSFGPRGKRQDGRKPIPIPDK